MSSTSVFPPDHGRLEIDPLGKSSKEPGSKLDAGKSPIYQGVMGYFPNALIAVASLSSYGANKYAWKGWEKVPDGINRYRNALGRHMLKEETEGVWDKDAENDPKYPGCILHATQVAWNALAALELLLREQQSKKARPVREQMDPIEYRPGGVNYETDRIL